MKPEIQHLVDKIEKVNAERDAEQDLFDSAELRRLESNSSHRRAMSKLHAEADEAGVNFNALLALVEEREIARKALARQERIIKGFEGTK